MSSRFLHTDRLQLKVIERQKKLAKFDRAVDSANYIFSRCYTNSDGSARYVNPMQCTAQAIVVGYYDRDPRPRCACLLYFDIDKACEMWTFCAWPMQMGNGRKLLEKVLIFVSETQGNTAIPRVWLTVKPRSSGGDTGLFYQELGFRKRQHSSGVEVAGEYQMQFVGAGNRHQYELIKS